LHSTRFVTGVTGAGVDTGVIPGAEVKFWNTGAE